MRYVTHRYVLALGLATAGLFWNGETWPTKHGGWVSTAEAVIGRPVTPVSYAGVARRSTVGVGAPGVGVAPGVGAGGVNLGGPVNRVGVH
jgi:hypothetical protein